MYLEPQIQLRHGVKEQKEATRVKREPFLTGLGHQNLGTHPVFSANFTKPFRSLR